MGRWITIFKRSIASFGTDKCATLAAAIAYRTIFALFPLALVGVSLLGFFVDDVSARQRVIDGLTGVISLGSEGEDALAQTLAGVSAARGWLGIVGLITAAWSASGLFGEFRSALDVVWDVDRPLPMLRGKLRDLVLLLGFGGLLGASTASTGVLQTVRDTGADWLGPVNTMAAPLYAVIAFALPLVLTFAAFLFLYKVAPHARLRLGAVVPAAVIAALFFEFGKNLLAYYIANLGNFNALAGSLGAAILFLVFVYYATQVVLFGAEVAKHRLLVVAGSVPPTDARADAPKVPLGEKITGMLKRLWSAGVTHHDPELPYAPSRQDPATNRPTNTREEILLKQQQAVEQAARDASTKPAGASSPPAHGVTTLRGEALLRGAMLSVRTPTGARPLVGGTSVSVIRNAKPASIDDIRTGDLLTVQTNELGGIERIDAQSTERLPEPARSPWLEAVGFVVTFIAQAIVRSRAKKADRSHQRGAALAERGLPPPERSAPSERAHNRAMARRHRRERLRR